MHPSTAHPYEPTAGPRGSMGPCESETRAEDGADRPELGDGKLTDGSVLTIVTYSTSRVDWCPWLAQQFTGATSSATMAARRRCSAVGSSSSTMTWLGERCYNIRES